MTDQTSIRQIKRDLRCVCCSIPAIKVQSKLHQMTSQCSSPRSEIVLDPIGELHKIHRTLLWFSQLKVSRPRPIFRQIHKTNDTRPWKNRDGRGWGSADWGCQSANFTVPSSTAFPKWADTFHFQRRFRQKNNHNNNNKTPSPLNDNDNNNNNNNDNNNNNNNNYHKRARLPQLSSPYTWAPAIYSKLSLSFSLLMYSKQPRRFGA